MEISRDIVSSYQCHGSPVALTTAILSDKRDEEQCEKYGEFWRRSAQNYTANNRSWEIALLDGWLALPWAAVMMDLTPSSHCTSQDGSSGLLYDRHTA